MFGPPRPFLATPRQALPSPAPPSHAPPCRALPCLDLRPASCPVSPDPSIMDARVRSIRGFPAPRFFGDRAFPRNVHFLGFACFLLFGSLTRPFSLAGAPLR